MMNRKKQSNTSNKQGKTARRQERQIRQHEAQQIRKTYKLEMINII